MEDLSSKQYFEDVSTKWDDMRQSFFGNAPRDRIYSEINVEDGMRIVDVGSGSGYLLEGLVDRKAELFAIDQSPAMLQVLNEKYAISPNVHAVEGTSESLPCSDNSIDIVVANMYLHHVERPEYAIKEMVRILKIGGTLVFTDLDEHNFDQLVREQHDRWMGFDRRDIQSWMELAGLTRIYIDDIGSNCCTSSCAGDPIQISIFIAKGIKR